MSLNNNRPVGFIPTTDARAAREFYGNTLGLQFESDDQFALVFRIGPEPGTMLRVVRTGSYTPPPFTVFGWEVDDIYSTVNDLKDKGVTFLRFSFLEQDVQGVWTAPGGSQIAWFHDPDGNTLSLSHHV